MIFHCSSDSFVKTTALIKICLAVTTKDHIASCQCVHIRLLFDTYEALFSNVCTLFLGYGLFHHLLHCGNQKAPCSGAYIEHFTVFLYICNTNKQFCYVAWRKNDAKSLLITTSVFQKFTIELPYYVKIVVHTHKRPYFVVQHSDKFTKDSFGVLYCGL